MAPLQLVGLTGRAGSGKDFMAENLWRSHGFLPLGFADAMKAEFAAGKGIAVRDLHDPATKEQYRSGMQDMGEGRRQEYGPDYWIKHLEAIMWTLAGRTRHNRYSVTDVRYLNEAEWVRSLGGIVVRLTGRGHTLSPQQQQHPSEVEVDLIEPHFEIDNGPEARGLEVCRATVAEYIAHVMEGDTE